MKKAVKITLITAGAVFLAGAVISAVAITMGAGKSGRGLSYRTETITDKITSVNISVSYDDIDIIQRDTDNISVRFTENSIKKYNISSQDGTLTISDAVQERKLKWYEYISFDFFDSDDDHKIVIETPRSFDAHTVITSDFGDINLSGIKGSLDAELSCGDIEIENCTFTALDCAVDYGDIEIKRTSAQSITAECDCGDIDFEDIDGNITARCDFGDIEFENISGDNLIFTNSCGDIEGIIRGKKSDYEPGGEKKLKAECDIGDVIVRFTE